MNDLPEILVITGPTATGKSKLAVRLAKETDGEIVSADSMQIYKLMDIGTAKPSVAEMDGIAHHCINHVMPRDEYSVARYVEDASKCIDDIIDRGKKPLLVGGTGLYIDSLLAGRSFSIRGDVETRKALEKEYDDIGGEEMLVKLRRFDAERAAILHANDKKRIVRALEAFMTSGKAISQHDIETKAIPPRYKSVKVALNFSDRAVLYDRIDRRVDGMISRGLADEVVSLLRMGVPKKCTAMQAIGYKEFAGILPELSEIDPLENVFPAAELLEVVEKIKMESRRYAKRQLTWLRRDKDINWITWEDAPDFDTGTRIVMELINEKK